MKFKNYEDYIAERTELLNKAQQLLNGGNLGEEYQSLKNDISKLDENFEAFRTEQANLNALQNTQKPNMNIVDYKNNDSIIKGYDGQVQQDGYDKYDSIDYRKAFMNHVLTGKSIPKEFINSNDTTKTSDVGVIIPNTVLNRIIEKLESAGMILPLVTRTAYKGGVTIPTSNVKPKAVWVSEGQGSNTQKKTIGSITFAYHKLRCAIAVSLETDVMAMSVFETTFVNSVSEAMLVALEQAIINGDGEGKPKGILAETVDEGKNIEIKHSESVDYQTLIDAESCLDLAYESKALWFMHKATFMSFVGMVDNNGQPIARVNYGINGAPERTLLGRKVVLNEYMPSIKSQLSKDEVVAFLFNPADYILNTNLNLTIKRYEDDNTDDRITKAVMLVDGKVVDNNSLVTITKKYQ